MTSFLSGSLPMIAGSNVVRYQPPAGDFSGVSRNELTVRFFGALPARLQ